MIYEIYTILNTVNHACAGCVQKATLKLHPWNSLGLRLLFERPINNITHIGIPLKVFELDIVATGLDVPAAWLTLAWQWLWCHWCMPNMFAHPKNTSENAVCMQCKSYIYSQDTAIFFYQSSFQHRHGVGFIAHVENTQGCPFFFCCMVAIQTIAPTKNRVVTEPDFEYHWVMFRKQSFHRSHCTFENNTRSWM